MSDSGELRHFAATTTASTSSSTPPDHSLPTITADLSISLRNLTAVQTRIDAVRTFLSNSLTTQTLIGQQQMELISTEISSSIHQIIYNGTNLISSSRPPIVPIRLQSTQKPDPTRDLSEPDLSSPSRFETIEEDISDEWETIELGSEELLAENSHFCEICGKGFKRDANLRMHMRAHGNQFKTPEALAKPEKFTNLGFKKIRFSCPLIGCNRNKCHNKFKPLKSVICVKNHYKRSHCPKTYACNRCNKKSFSVMVDLRNHLKHCGETKWKCSCGTRFSRKDKLFGHVALFEGHMPAIMEEDEKGKEMVDDEEVVTEGKELGMSVSDDGSLGRLVAGYDSVEDFCVEDMLNTPGDSGLGTDMDGHCYF